MLWECEMRVHMRSRTGVWNSSDSAKARRVKSRASWESDGSSMGTFAAMA